MTDQNADTTGAQNTDAGTQQTDATNAAVDTNAQDAAQQQQTGSDADAAKQGDEGKTDAKGDEKVIPEQYEFKLAEGVEPDAELVEELSNVAKELKLGQDEAQKFADLGGKMAQKWAAKQAEAVEQAKAEWLAASRSDKEFGGDKLDANLAVANKTFGAFGTPELRELLDKTGLGEHPEVIRWAYRVGQAISEDKIIVGDTANKVEKDPATVMFPSMKSA